MGVTTRKAYFRFWFKEAHPELLLHVDCCGLTLRSGDEWVTVAINEAAEYSDANMDPLLGDLLVKVRSVLAHFRTAALVPDSATLQLVQNIRLDGLEPGIHLDFDWIELLHEVNGNIDIDQYRFFD